MTEAQIHPTAHRVEAGHSLLDSVETIARAMDAPELWLRAVGEVNDARLSSGGGAGDSVVGMMPSAVLASCDIHVVKVGVRFEVRAWAVLGFDAAGTWATRAGRLTHAISEDVVLTALQGGGASAVAAAPALPSAQPATVSVTRAPSVSAAPSRSDALNAGTDRPRASLMSERAAQTLESRPAPERVAKPAPASAWDQLAAFSAQLDDDQEDDFDVDDLRPNDRLVHPSLGELRVLRVTPEGSVNVELRNKATRKLKMTPFLISRMDDGRYQLRLKNS